MVKTMRSELNRIHGCVMMLVAGQIYGFTATCVVELSQKRITHFTDIVLFHKAVGCIMRMAVSSKFLKTK